MSVVIVNEVLSYVQYKFKSETKNDLIKVLDDFYGADAISEAKSVLWQHYGAAGHDALPRCEDRRQTRNKVKSLKDKELEDILNGMKHIDQVYCTAKELPITFAAVNLVNLPSCNAGKTIKSDEIVDADKRDRMQCPVFQL